MSRYGHYKRKSPSWKEIIWTILLFLACLALWIAALSYPHLY